MFKHLKLPTSFLQQPIVFEGNGWHIQIKVTSLQIGSDMSKINHTYSNPQHQRPTRITRPPGSSGPRITRATRFTGPPKLTRPGSSSGPRTTRPPKFTILQQPRKRMQIKWDDGSLQCLYANSCWVWIRKTDERTFLSDTREVVMGEGILQLPTWWHGSLVTTSTSWPALPPPLPHCPADLVRRAERALLLPANNPTTTPSPNPELDTS